jgi:hypothetical protein
MNAYSRLLRYIRSLAEQDVFVKTITTGADIDLNKGDIFPLFNIDITDATFSSNATITFSLNIQCLDIRDINNENVNDKFYLNDNEVDNYNGTLSCLNALWVKMHRDFEDNNITASDSPTLTQITYSDKNLLDGWDMSLEVEMPIDETSFCFWEV